MAEEKKKTTTKAKSKAKTKPKTKKCKHCKSDMPYAAKVCPTCGRRQGGGVLKIIMILILALVLIGVGIEIGTQTGQLDVKNNSGEQKNSDSENGQEEIGGDPNVEMVADYTLPDSIGWYTRRFMVVTNNSNKTAHITTSSLAYGQDGSVVSADDSEFHALGAGCTSVIREAFETAESIDHYDTDMKAEESKYYDSVIADLSYVQNDVSGGAVFQVTNNGEEPAQYVQGCALFFMDDTLVGYEETYFVDDESEIKPGQTISQQMTSYSDFNRIEFYLDGRK